MATAPAPIPTHTTAARDRPAVSPNRYGMSASDRAVETSPNRGHRYVQHAPIENDREIAKADRHEADRRPVQATGDVKLPSGAHPSLQSSLDRDAGRCHTGQLHATTGGLRSDSTRRALLAFGTWTAEDQRPL